LGDRSSEGFAFVFTPRARRDLRRAAAWWKRNRGAALSLLAEEVEAALLHLTRFPDAGVRVTRRRAVRRQLLPGSRYHLFHRVDRTARRIEVLAIWHTSRDGGPFRRARHAR
jgi:plasmid stabilization system protein ParE